MRESVINYMTLRLGLLWSAQCLVEGRADLPMGDIARIHSWLGEAGAPEGVIEQAKVEAMQRFHGTPSVGDNDDDRLPFLQETFNAWEAERTSFMSEFLADYGLSDDQ